MYRLFCNVRFRFLKSVLKLQDVEYHDFNDFSGLIWGGSLFLKIILKLIFKHISAVREGILSVKICFKYKAKGQKIKKLFSQCQSKTVLRFFRPINKNVLCVQT
ncbi:MAG: hypothetical protein CR968_01165 [Flavobacteriia bacterium]|nr:MAG: hypothetical protein CR968_01165 [Flavobacteriia bacterium]